MTHAVPGWLYRHEHAVTAWMARHGQLTLLAASLAAVLLFAVCARLCWRRGLKLTDRS